MTEKRTKLCVIALVFNDINPTSKDYIKGVEMFNKLYKQKKNKLLQELNKRTAEYARYNYPIVVELLGTTSSTHNSQFIQINARLACIKSTKSERRTMLLRTIINDTLNKLFNNNNCDNELFIVIDGVKRTINITLSPLSGLSKL